MREHIEADDLMAIIQSNPDNAGKTIIVSDDKDLLSCPGKLYRPTRGEKLDISEADADRAFLTQVLTGDSADSTWLPWYCPKKAEAIWAAGQRAVSKLSSKQGKHETMRWYRRVLPGFCAGQLG